MTRAGRGTLPAVVGQDSWSSGEARDTSESKKCDAIQILGRLAPRQSLFMEDRLQ